MNIIDTEDMIKGLPDAALQKEAQNPSGQAPQFLVVSEIKRRKDMRARYAQNQKPQGTVKDQLLGVNPTTPQRQMASMGQPQGRPMPPMGGQMPMQQPAPQMGMYSGGVVRMAQGLTIPNPYLNAMSSEDAKLAERENNLARLAYLAELPGGSEAVRDMQGRIGGITQEDVDSIFGTAQEQADASKFSDLNELINPSRVGSYIEGLTESRYNPLDRFTQGVSTDFEPLNPPMFKAPTPQESTDTRSNPFQAPAGTADAIRAKLASMKGQGQGDAPVGEMLQSILAESNNQVVNNNAEVVVPEERIRGLQFPTGLSGVDSSSSGRQGDDQARMNAAQAARLREIQGTASGQQRIVQAPDAYTDDAEGYIRAKFPDGVPTNNEAPKTFDDYVAYLQTQKPTLEEGYPLLSNILRDNANARDAEAIRLSELENETPTQDVTTDLRALRDRQAERGSGGFKKDLGTTNETISLEEAQRRYPELNLEAGSKAFRFDSIEMPAGFPPELRERAGKLYQDGNKEEAQALIDMYSASKTEINPEDDGIAALITDKLNRAEQPSVGQNTDGSARILSNAVTEDNSKVIKENVDVATALAAASDESNAIREDGQKVNKLDAETIKTALSETNVDEKVDKESKKFESTGNVYADAQAGIKNLNIASEDVNYESARTAIGDISTAADKIRNKTANYESLIKGYIPDFGKYAPDYSSLIQSQEARAQTIRDEARKEAGAQALIQLGAGIAGGNLSKGISEAGKTAADIRRQGRKEASAEEQLSTRMMMSQQEAKMTLGMKTEESRQRGRQATNEMIVKSYDADRRAELVAAGMDVDAAKAMAGVETEAAKAIVANTQADRKFALDQLTTMISAERYKDLANDSERMRHTQQLSIYAPMISTQTQDFIDSSVTTPSPTEIREYVEELMRGFGLYRSSGNVETGNMQTNQNNNPTKGRENDPLGLRGSYGAQD